jgi:hypothetical protein
VRGFPDVQGAMAMLNETSRISRLPGSVAIRAMSTLQRALPARPSHISRSAWLKGPDELDLVAPWTQCFEVVVAFTGNRRDRLASVNSVMYLNRSSSGFGDYQVSSLALLNADSHFLQSLSRL